MTAASDSDDLYFASLVRGYVEENPRFVRRDWLAEELDGKLREPDKRFVLLTAEPGAGKSVFMAQLAHDHPEWLRYFIRRDQREVLADVSARSLLLRVGYQLAARHPELFSKDQLTLSVKQRLGEVAEQGEAVGVEVERLIASPFYRMVLEIEQQVQVDRGKVVGLRAKELYFEERLLPAEELLHLALIDPARALQRADPQRQLIILIDALDEIRYHPSTDNILTWLTNCPELTDNIRFVLTSRPPDETLRLFCHKQGSRLGELTIAEGDANVTRDVSKFVAELVSEPALNEVLQVTPDAGVNFAAKATDKAKGNLGYLDALARGLDQALAETRTEEESIRLRGRGTLDALLSLKELPADLGGLYAFFLHQIKEGVADQQIVGKDSSGKTFSTDVWSAVHDPILGVLAVAAEPLELELIAKLGDIAVDLKWVRPALNRLRQFLDVVDGRYRFYHATVAEFIIAETTRANSKTADVHQDATQWHKRISKVYRGNAKSWNDVDWSKVDDYGVRHLGSHLYAMHSDPAYGGELYALCCKSYMQEKCGRTGSPRAFAQDVDLGFDAARHETPPNLIQAARTGLLYATLGNISAAVPAELLGVHAQLVGPAGALGYAALISDPTQRCRTYVAIAAALPAAVPRKERLDILDMASVAAEAIGDEVDKASALGDVAVGLAQTGEYDHALRIPGQSQNVQVLSRIALSSVHEGNYDTAFVVLEAIPGKQDKLDVLIGLAQGLMQAGQTQRARNAFTRAFEAAEALEAGWPQDHALEGLAQALAQTGEYDQAFEVADRIQDRQVEVGTLTGLSQLLVQMGQGRRARIAATRALEVAKMIESAWPQEQALGGVAQALARAGERDQAFEVVQTIQSPQFKTEAIAGLVHGLAEAGEFEPAFEVVETIADRNVRAGALMRLARVLVQMRRVERAQAAARGALDVLKVIESELSKVQELISVAEQLTQSGEHDRALKVVDTIQDEFKSDALRVVERARMSEAQRTRHRERQPLEVTWRVSAVQQTKADTLSVLAEALTQAEEYDQAFEVAEAIQDQKVKVELLTRLVQTLMQMKQGERARSTAKRAFEVLKTIHDLWTKTQVQNSVAQALAVAGECDRALEVVGMSEEKESKAAMLSTIAAAGVQTGNGGRVRNAATQAVMTVKMNESQQGKAEALSSLAEALAQSGDHDRALRTIHMIDLPRAIKVSALTKLAQSLLQHGEKERARTTAQEALEVAKDVYWNWIDDEVRIGLAQTLLRAGEDQQAFDVVDTNTHNRIQAKVLTALAQTLVEMGNYKRAFEVASESGDEWIQADVLNGLAQILWKMGQEELARGAEAQAFEVAETIDYRVGKEAAFRDLARAQAQVGEYDRALEIVSRIHDAWTKAEALSGVAQGLAQSGHCDKAVKVVEMIKEPRRKAEALSGLALLLVQTGEKQRALEVVQMIEEVSVTADVLKSVAIALAQIGEHDESFELTETIEDGRVQAQAQAGLAAELAAAGLHDRALEVAASIKDKRVSAEALTRLAQTLVQAGESTRALEVVATIGGPQLKAEALAGLLDVVTRTRATGEAAQVAMLALDLARLHTRDAVFSVLSRSAGGMAILGGAALVWGISQAIGEIDGWWS